MPIRSRFISLYHPTIFIERASLLQSRRVMAENGPLTKITRIIIQSTRCMPKVLLNTSKFSSRCNFKLLKNERILMRDQRFNRNCHRVSYLSKTAVRLASWPSFLSLFSTCTQRLFRTQLKKIIFDLFFVSFFFLNRTAFPVLSCTPSSKNLISVPHYNKSTGLPKSGKKNKRTRL